MNLKIKTAILGAGGNWAQNVIRNILKIPEINLMFCVDTDIQKLEKIRNKVPYSTQLFTDTNFTLNNPDVEAVIIVTPISSHPQLVQAALLKGKHVLCQKAVFRTESEIEKVYPILFEEGAKSQLMGCHTFCYHPAIQHIANEIHSGVFGKTRYYKSTRVNLGLFSRDSNVLDDLLVHDSSILCYLFPNEVIEYISATGTDTVKPGIIDTANVSIKYKSGLLANIDLSWVSAVKNRQILIVGEKQTVLYDDVKSENKVCYFDAGIDYDENLLFSYKKGEMRSPKIAETEAIENELIHFVSCIKNKKEPISGPRHIAKVTKMLETANKSVLSNGLPYYFK